MKKEIFVYTDGGARGNPGQAAIGVIILDEKQECNQNRQRISWKGNR